MAKGRKNPLFHLEGADELNAALRRLGDRTTGLLLKQSAEAGAKVIADEAKRLAPRDSGDLAEGIEVKPGRIQQGRAVFNVQPGKAEWYGKLVELGTEKMPAQPFLRPALDAKAQEATEAVQEVLRDALRDVLE
jgi:HK97 gp10 family phage protein